MIDYLSECMDKEPECKCVNKCHCIDDEHCETCGAV